MSLSPARQHRLRVQAEQAAVRVAVFATRRAMT
ncbi:Uncharacterised protein [Escherichia coli]|nr:Uncharacterised protein [Escherichia coli]